MLERPDDFRFNIHSPLANGLVFAGLGRRGSDKVDRYEDCSLYGNHGTLTNMDPPTDWVWDSTLNRFALDFDGSNDFVDLNAEWIGGTSLFAEATQAFTVSFWGSRTNAGTYIARAGATTNARTFQVWQNNTTLAVYFRGISTNLTTTIASVWFHACFTWNGTSAASYFNGSELASPTVSSAVEETGQRICIGARTNGTGYFQSGQITDPLIHSRALSLPEIQQLADPSNVMLSGLILPPQRKFWAVPTAAPPASSARNLIIGGGVL